MTISYPINDWLLSEIPSSIFDFVFFAQIGKNVSLKSIWAWIPFNTTCNEQIQQFCGDSAPNSDNVEVNKRFCLPSDEMSVSAAATTQLIPRRKICDRIFDIVKV